MLLKLHWTYFDTTGSQKFKLDNLIVSEDEAKTILKEAIRFWDREESFPSAGGECPNLIKSHVKTFGFDSTIPAIYQQYSKNYPNELGFPTLYDIKIGNTSVFDEAEAEEEKISDKYWEENEDADGTDEPLITDESVLDKFVEKLIQENTNV
jgi:hypothetical protein